MRAGGKPQLSSLPTIWGKGDPRLLAAGVGVPRPSDVLQHPGVDAGHLRKRPRLGRRGGLGRTESLGRWARVACPSCPPAVYSVCSFDPSSCPVKPPLSKSPVPVPLSPPHSPKKISYHCCICNLWIRGLSIYYYWLIIIIIIIIDYVNLPPVCLSRWVSEVTLGVEDALVPPPRPTPVLSRRQWWGPLVEPHNPGGRSHGPFPSLRPSPGCWCPVASGLGHMGAFAFETLAEVSRYQGRSPCLNPPAQPLSVCGGAPGTGQEPLPGQSHPLPGGGRSGAPSPAGPVPWHGVPRMDLPPPIICWKVQRRRGGRSPCTAPSPSGLGCPPTCPPLLASPSPSAAAFCSLSCPLLLYLETTCCNKS